MDIAKDLSKQTSLSHQSFFVIAREQTHGRGRLGRVWLQSNQDLQSNVLNQFNSTESDFKNNFSNKQSFSEVYQNEDDLLPFTFALHAKELKIPFEWISLMTGVAVYEAFLTIEKFIRKNFSQIFYSRTNIKNFLVKWPNDIIFKTSLDGVKKIAGILCETKVNPASLNLENEGQISHVFIGIGINFFQSPPISHAGSFVEDVLNINTQDCFSVAEKQSLLAHFSSILEEKLRKYLCEFYSSQDLKKAVEKVMFPKGTVLRIPSTQRIGVFAGLSADGSLTLQLESGIKQQVYSADGIELMKNRKNLICVDFGNTRIHITGNNDSLEQSHLHLQYQELEQKNIEDKFKNIVKLFVSNLSDSIEVVYISVNSPKKTEMYFRILYKILKSQLKNKNLSEKEITEKDIFKNYAISQSFDQSTLGADRALKCIFAYQRSQKILKNVIVVSFGTATTCEGFSPNGKMIENFVYPGIQMSFDALHHFTALLPRIDAQSLEFVRDPEYWTQDLYLKRGIILSLVSSILLAAQLHSPCEIVLSGGNAEQVKSILMSLAPPDFIKSVTIQTLDNIETKVIAECYENFR